MAQAIEQSSVPATMRALAIAAYGKPSTFGIATVPTPQITQPDEVLIKVHAASINPIDIILADGALKIASKDT
jgi:NADPH:quinone reductase-like Zn-dependent oxidoreductase